MRKLAAVALLCLPVPLSAQASRTISPYVASDGGIAGQPTLVGATLGVEFWRVGARMGGGIDSRLFGGPTPDAGLDPTRSWTLDGDALVFLGNRDDRAAVVPYAVAGAGLRTLHGRESMQAVGTWSAGAGVRAPLVGPVALEGEIRHRRLLVQHVDQIPAGVSPGTEFRVALTYRMGALRSVDTRAPLPTVTFRAPAAPRSSPAAGAGSASMVVQRTLSAADQYLGVPYRWGGNTPTEGFDCSGFIKYVYGMHGVTLPRVSRDQARVGTPLPLDISSFQPGDLLAFASNGSVVDHIAIYAGDGMIIHSSSSGGGVRYDDLNSRRGRWYADHMVAARRVLDAPVYVAQ